jgi:hypothetical protein
MALSQLENFKAASFRNTKHHAFDIISIREHQSSIFQNFNIKHCAFDIISIRELQSSII